MVRLARALPSLPLLCQAVDAGVISPRKALELLPVFSRAPRDPAAAADYEAAWVERARAGTVEALRSTVAQALGAAPRDDERWLAVDVKLSATERATVEKALDVARRVLGGGASKWQCLEAMCQEYLSSHPELQPSELEVLRHWMSPEMVQSVRAYLEAASKGWFYLDQSAAPVPVRPDPVLTNPFELHAKALELARAREQWDALIGRLAMLIKMYGLWRDMGFESFEHYCNERLGLSASNVEKRARLERRLFQAPQLRDATASAQSSNAPPRAQAEHRLRRVAHPSRLARARGAGRSRSHGRRPAAPSA